MTRETHQFLGQRENLGNARIRWINPGAARFFLADAVHRPAPERAGQRAHSIFGEPENFADLANGTAAAIADHCRRNAATLTRIALVDILDDLLTPFMFEIN